MAASVKSSKVVYKGMSRATRLLCQHGAEALKPQKVNDKWRPPRLSARQQAKIRKTAMVEGTFGEFDSATGKGWDPKWDKLGKVSGFSMRHPKLRKYQRTREDRAKKIENLVEGMDAKIEAYMQAKRDAKPESGIVNAYNKMMGKLKKN
mmetsp:Transcript_10920/g.16356  ORF Transcript_10920/g.16356 Transcript_10920/m.16356 type:complete len:149 (-) Transcript_10920:212-658(-)|eukprot:CAMPEP_0196816948 /NCGR_PEP_ID=MMETSP1362-20130617/57789_1 /TAXON_ID=163516 /ORGANISM="Leptocylindrus danicus, Strain CCMP1856" /LENGTH=148 /DNA_ID=CAMNT_0042194443 /DNA_START=122 /DNA_END=568 /DNA_ORIENTATION=+